MKLDLETLNPGVRRIEGNVSAQTLGLPADMLVPEGPVRVGLVVNKTEELYTVRGDARVVVRLVCARCMGEFQSELSEELYLVIRRLAVGEPGLHAQDEAQDDADLVIVPPEEHLVDLTERLREAVILAIPFVALCRDDCQGLCPQCGADLNAGPCGCAEDQVDPRWEPLRKLLTPS
jgi:uncharacterized protein